MERAWLGVWLRRGRERLEEHAASFMHKDPTMKTIHDLRSALPQVGRLEWIGLRPARQQPTQVVAQARVRAGRGLEGDRKASSGKGGPRQVTLIQAEHLPVIGALLAQAAPDPSTLRRNLVVSGIPLIALKDRRFRIGEVLFEGTGPCDPCSRMEEALGPGGWNAMRGHGGLTARALNDGEIHVGDWVVAEDAGPSDGARPSGER